MEELIEKIKLKVSALLGTEFSFSYLNGFLYWINFDVCMALFGYIKEPLDSRVLNIKSLVYETHCNSNEFGIFDCKSNEMEEQN